MERQVWDALPRGERVALEQGAEGTVRASVIRQLSPLAVAWGLAQDVLVGYGYRPGRAALWLLCVTALGAAVFHLFPPTALTRTFNRS